MGGRLAGCKRKLASAINLFNSFKVMKVIELKTPTVSALFLS